MALKMKASSAGEFENPAPGMCGAVCIRVIDWGTQDWGNFGPKRRVQITWELDENMKDGRPFIVGKMYTISMNKKARLRQDLEGWRGKAFHDDDDVDMSTLLGKHCMLNLAENEKGRTEVVSIGPLPKAMTGLKPVNPFIYFDLDDPDWDAFNELHESTQKKIAATQEFKVSRAHQPSSIDRDADLNDDLDDDIPF